MSRTRRISRRCAMSWRVFSKRGLPVRRSASIAPRLNWSDAGSALENAVTTSGAAQTRRSSWMVVSEMVASLVSLLREVEAGDAHLRRLLLVLHEHDVGAQQAMHHALAVHLVEGLRDAHPQVGADAKVGLLLAACVWSVALDPGGQRDALEVLERQYDAGLVGERRVGGEHAFAATQAPEDLSLPPGALGDAVALRSRGERGHAVDAQEALGARERVRPSSSVKVSWWSSVSTTSYSRTRRTGRGPLCAPVKSSSSSRSAFDDGVSARPPLKRLMNSASWSAARMVFGCGRGRCSRDRAHRHRSWPRGTRALRSTPARPGSSRSSGAT
jgi:hypothetical protein